MSRRVVLIACLESTETPWQRLRGSEVCARVIGLEEGGSVRLEVCASDGSDLNLELVDGVNSLSPIRGRFRVVKTQGPVPQATTVELNTE